MGSPKHLLALPDGPLYLYLTSIVYEALPETTVVYVSIASRSVLDESIRNGIVTISSMDGLVCTVINIEIIMDAEEHDIDLAAGLLVAHQYAPTATWLVIACDYPFLQAARIRQLIEKYEPLATCFKNLEGFSEPLLGICDP
jgi:molybdopterin-guanine dinucleotide biosynthesis protein A